MVAVVVATAVWGGCQDDRIVGHTETLALRQAEPNSGNGQSDTALATLATPLRVMVTRNGMPAAGVPVSWTVAVGQGTVRRNTSTTDADGVASTVWTLGPAWGVQAAEATVLGANGSPVRFTASARPRQDSPVVSEPVAAAPSGLVPSPAPSSGANLTYVSLPSGTVPGGVTATVLNQNTGRVATAGMVAGGFDPVPVAATVGDSLLVTIQREAGQPPIALVRVVPPRRRPIVVRTEPPPQKRDVPLNASIVVVFSEPVDPASLTTETVQLKRGTTPVASRVEFQDPHHLTVVLVPSALLDMEAEYQLVIAQGVRDMNGDTLEAPTSLVFVTGVAQGSPVASIVVSPDSTLSRTNEAVRLQATARDASGAVLAGRLTWTTSDPRIATVDSTGLVMAHAVGPVTITAASGAVQGSAWVMVISGSLSWVVRDSNPTGTQVGDRLRLVARVDDFSGRAETGLRVEWSTTYAPHLRLDSASSLGDTVFVTAATAGRGSLEARLVTRRLPSVLANQWIPISVRAKDQAVASVTVSPDTVNAAPFWLPGGPNEALALHVTLRDSTGREMYGVPIAWTSSAPGIATVYGSTEGGVGDIAPVETGQVFGRGVPGTAVITASAGGLADSVVVVFEYRTLAKVDVGEGTSMPVRGVLCYLDPAGAALCSEDRHNAVGLRGNGLYGSFYPAPVAILGRHRYTEITQGVLHTCALQLGGTAHCWGRNDTGVLGNATGLLGNGGGSDSPIPVPVAGGLTFSQVRAGFLHTCALAVDGTAYCWGTNQNGQLGNGTTVNSAVPVAVAGGHRFSSISAGSEHSCGLTSGGQVYCWGWNGSGQLGDGTLLNRTVPVPVVGGPPFTQLTAGGAVTCGLTAEGVPYCWGFKPALGIDTGGTSPAPVPIALPPGITLTQIDAGNGPTCGLGTDGTPFCWGFYTYDWFNPFDSKAVPYPAVSRWGPLRFTSISSGTAMVCGVTAESVVYCWDLGRDGLMPYKVPGQR